MNGLEIISTGHYVPPKVMSNYDFEKMIDTNNEWIVTRTGIHNRHYCVEETTVDLAYNAAKNALEKSGINKESIGIVIVATMTPDNLTPSTACLVQAKLGIESQVMSFDISAACSGFVYALDLVRGLLSISKKDYALIIGAEKLTSIIDFDDRGTCVLFGDGAGALIVKKRASDFYSYMNASGNKDVLFANRNEQKLKMNGKEVFKFAVRVIPECIEEVLQDAGYTKDDIDFVVCHQANERIISHVYKKMKMDKSKFYTNLNEYGNTSGASIPLALSEMNEKGMLKKGMKIICVGFGGGLTYGATLFEW